MIPKAPKLGITVVSQSQSSTSSSALPRASAATWICPICSFSNPIPVYFDPANVNENTTLPACLTCGIKPSLAHILKASIANLSSSRSGGVINNSSSQVDTSGVNLNGSGTSTQCPRCTFHNHPSLLACEICGSSLPVKTPASADGVSDSRARSASPAAQSQSSAIDVPGSIKLSFRAGGEKIFYERLKGALQQRKWLSQSAPPVPDSSISPHHQANNAERSIGIAGLERRGQQLRKNNELVIGNAFEDLEALMASAKDIIALAERLASHTKESSPPEDASISAAEDPSTLLSQLNLTTTREMLSTNASNTSLYLTELARSLAEFLMDDVRGVLRSEGGIITMVDLWSVYNRARGGVELVSPTDFSAATKLFEKLDLPVRRRNFRSGLLAVQERSRTEEKSMASILAWLRTLRELPPHSELPWDWRDWGRGIAAQDAAKRFGWSVGVAEEELEMAEERGALCRESSLEGTFYWENLFPL